MPTVMDRLPVVFMTGYKVTYVPGGSLMPIIKPYPLFGHPRTWDQWYYHYSLLGIAVFYKGNYAIFLRPGMEISHAGKDRIVLKFNTPSTSDGSTANFLPSDFDPKGKTYRQLTPDGPLP
jgi:hypothetical protein